MEYFVNTPTTVPLLRVKIYTDSVIMAHINVPLITKQFRMSASLRSELLKQILVYFWHKGILNKESLLFMMDSSDCPTLSTYAVDEQPLKAIMVPIILFSSKIEKYTVCLQDNSVFLVKSSKFS